eukprot:403333952
MLIRHTIKQKKPLLGLGLGFNLLNLYSTTGLPYDHIFYLEQQISPETLNTNPLTKQKYKKVIIDEQSGDYYLFNSFDQKLQIMGHIGFFNNYQLKRKQFDVSPMRQDYRLTSNEYMAKIRKIFVQHFSVKGLSMHSFKVNMKQSQWSTLQQPPQFSASSSGKYNQFKTIVEDVITKHSLVIELNNAAFGILYDINQSEPNGFFIFKNTLKHLLSLVVSKVNGYSDKHSYISPLRSNTGHNTSMSTLKESISPNFIYRDISNKTYFDKDQQNSNSSRNNFNIRNSMIKHPQTSQKDRSQVDSKSFFNDPSRSSQVYQQKSLYTLLKNKDNDATQTQSQTQQQFFNVSQNTKNFIMRQPKALRKIFSERKDSKHEQSQIEQSVNNNYTYSDDKQHKNTILLFKKDNSVQQFKDGSEINCNENFEFSIFNKLRKSRNISDRQHISRAHTSLRTQNQATLENTTTLIVNTKNDQTLEDHINQSAAINMPNISKNNAKLRNTLQNFNNVYSNNEQGNNLMTKDARNHSLRGSSVMAKKQNTIRFNTGNESVNQSIVQSSRNNNQYDRLGDRGFKSDVMRSISETPGNKKKKSIKIYASPVNKLYKRYREFQQMEYSQMNIDQNQEYGEPQQAVLLGEKLLKDGFRPPIDKAKWITKQNFNGIVGVASTGRGFGAGEAAETYVSRDPSETPLLHKFREQSPSKWIYGSFKF